MTPVPAETSATVSPTVLIVTDAYYPLTMAGAHRPAKMAKFLSAFGWRPIVLCREWTAANGAGYVDSSLGRDVDVCETIRVPHPGLSPSIGRRLLRKVEDLLWPYRAPIALQRAMVRSGCALAASRKIDALWSSFAPGFVHGVASSLARRFEIPWVADFRDLPDQTFHDYRARRLVAAERRVCAGAGALTVTTPALAEILARRHDVPVHVIANGFDEDDYPSRAPAPRPHFVIAYFGILYPFRDPTPVFAALDALAAASRIELEVVRVRFYGSDAARIQSLAQRFACRDSVEVLPRVGRSAMLELQRDASVLLNLQSSEAGGAVPSKLLEYVGARRPVLNVPGDGGPIDELVRNTRSGITARGREEVAVAIADWFAEWRRCGVTTLDENGETARDYSRRRQAEKLSDVLRSVRSRDAQN